MISGLRVLAEFMIQSLQSEALFNSLILRWCALQRAVINTINLNFIIAVELALKILIKSFQAFYYGKVVEKANTMTTLTDKVSAFLKGPGWFPGTPRLGDPMGVPEIQQREKYDPKVAGWINVYAVLHFVLVIWAADDLSRYNLVILL